MREPNSGRIINRAVELTMDDTDAEIAAVRRERRERQRHPAQ